MRTTVTLFAIACSLAVAPAQSYTDPLLLPYTTYLPVKLPTPVASVTTIMGPVDRYVLDTGPGFDFQVVQAWSIMNQFGVQTNNQALSLCVAPTGNLPAMPTSFPPANCPGAVTGNPMAGGVYVPSGSSLVVHVQRSGPPGSFEGVGMMVNVLPFAGAVGAPLGTAGTPFFISWANVNTVTVPLNFGFERIIIDTMEYSTTPPIPGQINPPYSGFVNVSGFVSVDGPNVGFDAEDVWRQSSPGSTVQLGTPQLPMVLLPGIGNWTITAIPAFNSGYSQAPLMNLLIFGRFIP